MTAPRIHRGAGARAVAAPARLVRPALVALLVLLAPRGGGAQSAAADLYVHDGLRNAWSQRQQQLTLDAAAARRREVLGASLPSLDFNSTRTEVGGNIVDIGRFINPAYAALNQLLQQPTFPTNLSFRLPFRQQTSFRLTQPVLAPAAWYGAAAAARAERAQRAGRDAASRQLAGDIRLAWLNWHKATSAVAIYEAALPLLDEQVRVSERLVQSGLRTPDAVLRARADLSAVRQDRLAASQQADAAGRYLNHLVARPLETAIAGMGDLPVPSIPPLDSALAAARAGREELRQLDQAGRAADAQRRSAQAAFVPTVAVALDYGIQGNDYRWQGNREFRTATVVAQWNLFSGAADRARVEQATLQRRGLAARREEVESLIELQVRTAHQAAVVARASIDAATDQLAAAERAYQLVRRRHEEGLAATIELLDARRAYTAAAINRVLTINDYHARRIELARAAALEPGTQP